jgi:hypothetical protein
MSLVKSPLIALTKPDIQDFSIVMLTKTLGSLVGAPLMTVLWVQAIELGGAGLGLPYFVSAVSGNVTRMLVAHYRIVYIRIGCSRCGALEGLIKQEHYTLFTNHETSGIAENPPVIKRGKDQERVVGQRKRCK